MAEGVGKFRLVAAHSKRKALNCGIEQREV